MSNRLLRLAFAADCKSIAEKAVLVSLADMANEEGWCYPSIDKTARRISADEKTVRRALPQLVDAGHITVAPAGTYFTKHKGRGFEYRVHPQCGQEVRIVSGQRVRSESIDDADILSTAEDTESGASGQDARSKRAESPPNHQVTIIESSQLQPSARVARKAGGGGDLSSKGKGTTPIPPDFKPSAHTRAWCIGEGFGDPDQYLDQFVSWAHRSGAHVWDWQHTFCEAIFDNHAKVKRSGQPNPLARECLDLGIQGPSQWEDVADVKKRIAIARAAMPTGATHV